MTRSLFSSGSARSGRGRSSALGRRRRAARPAPTKEPWAAVFYGCVALAAAGLILLLCSLFGCTITEVTLYKTVNHPAPVATSVHLH